MDATLVPIFQGLITVAGALGGTWLGVRLSKGREERQWRPDRCLDAYAEVLTLSTQVLERCEGLAGTARSLNALSSAPPSTGAARLMREGSS